MTEVNFAELALARMTDSPRRLALWTVDEGTVTFGALRSRIARAQSSLIRRGIRPGDSVLVADLPGPNLYAVLFALLALGAKVLVVEPWMKIVNIDHVVRSEKPKLFVAGWFGRLWGLRVPSIRAIRRWEGAATLVNDGSPFDLVVESVPPETPGTITFTSGTSGAPKGIIRGHGYLRAIFDVIDHHLRPFNLTGPDLTIFANVVLVQLSNGRGSVWVPPSWSRDALQKIAALKGDERPQSLACGPAFLRRMFSVRGFDSLSTIFVGGALTDCDVFDEAFQRFSRAEIQHIYGGTEAEPVAHVDARAAVRASRSRGYFQTLLVGRPIDDIETQLAPEGLWVSGPNVCSEYIGAPDENKLYKRRDESGKLWHFMGDRMREDAEGFWYDGRSFQSSEDFALEQSIYDELQSSACFVHTNQRNEKILVGERLAGHSKLICTKYPQLSRVVDTEIVRDRRHRARIDRPLTLKKARA